MNEKPTIEVEKVPIITKFIYTLGVLPTSYLMSMTYQEQVTWLCNYISQTLIPQINEDVEAIQELQNLFELLRTYVNDYFDNLDVQEEINNKLDEMYQSGSLTTLIENYVNPYINQQNMRIDSLAESVDLINTKVDKATSGSPLVASSTSGMTDTNRVYVNTTDGYWYYYNGSTWVQGGIYQASEDSNTVSNLENTVENIVLSYHGNNWLDEDNMEVGQLQEDGTIMTGGAYNNYRTSDYIPVGLNTKFTFTTYDPNDPLTSITRAKRWILYDENKNIIADSYQSTSTSMIFADVTGASYLKYCFIRNYNGAIVVSAVVPGEALFKYEPYKLNYVSTTQIIDNNQYKTIAEFKNGLIVKNETHNKNLHNPATDQVGKFLSGYFIASLSNYTTTDYIPIYTNQDVVISPYCRSYVLYDSLKRPYLYKNISETTVQTITPRENGYIRVSFTNALQNLQIEYDEQTAFVSPDFKNKFEENVYLSDTMKQEIESFNFSNVLSNKKLVTCGDSFTQYTNAQFNDGPYQGQNKVWPFLIGLRNNMTVVNMAVSGSTMAINSYSSTNFANTLYTQIPNDADYIIIKYGINDVNGNTPIGTIDSTDDTTFYGAWNKVMSYIIANHPTAKIGIIVTNGLVMNTSQPNNSYYANAIIEIAKKYGIPTLNEWNDPNVPLLLRTGRNDVLTSIKTLRLETFRVAPDNTHENYICHEYESTFIEDFLRRL